MLLVRLLDRFSAWLGIEAKHHGTEHLETEEGRSLVGVVAYACIS